MEGGLCQPRRSGTFDRITVCHTLQPLPARRAAVPDARSIAALDNAPTLPSTRGAVRLVRVMAANGAESASKSCDKNRGAECAAPQARRWITLSRSAEAGRMTARTYKPSAAITTRPRRPERTGDGVGGVKSLRPEAPRAARWCHVPGRNSEFGGLGR